MYSTRFLEAEDLANNFLFNVSFFNASTGKADNGSRTRFYPFLFSINQFIILSFVESIINISSHLMGQFHTRASHLIPGLHIVLFLSL